MQYEIMTHVDPALLESREVVRDFAERMDLEMYEDSSKADPKWRRDGDPGSRFFGRDEFWCANLLISGEVWPHRMPESLPLLGGEVVEIDEGLAAMMMRPGVVRATSEYLKSLNIEDLRDQNTRYFSQDSFGSVEERLELGSRTVASLLDFYELAATDGRAVINVGCVV